MVEDNLKHTYTFQVWKEGKQIDLIILTEEELEDKHINILLVELERKWESIPKKVKDLFVKNRVDEEVERLKEFDP